jgi:hypothetical protein
LPAFDLGLSDLRRNGVSGLKTCVCHPGPVLGKLDVFGPGLNDALEVERCGKGTLHAHPHSPALPFPLVEQATAVKRFNPMGS